MPAGTIENVITCASAVSPCPVEAQITKSVYLVNPSYASVYDQLMNITSIDWTTVVEAFGLGLVMFATGSGVGLLINVVRQLRRI